jgi:hypothetical protein
MKFTLVPGRWYACEIIGDEFGEDKCSYSPVRVEELVPGKGGNRTFELRFHHSNYPEGVQSKQYRLQTIERGASFLLAKCLDHTPPRFLQIYDIDADWIMRHFPGVSPERHDVQQWLDRHG